MPAIDLGYGLGSIGVSYDENRFTVIGQRESPAALTDAGIGAKIDSPIDSRLIDEIVSPDETVLFVVADNTRRTGCGQIINLLVRRLIAAGTMPFDIRIIFATGIHRKVTEAEKGEILTPFIAQRIKTLDHDPRDLARLVRLGETSGGIPVELNRALLEHDHVIIVGGISFHYFAGFTGGRKLICPGLASSQTISKTHKLAFDCETKRRGEDVDTGRLDGNAVHQAFVEVAAKIRVAFAFNTIVDDAGSVVDLFCGDWLASHRAACDAYAADHTYQIEEKRDIVIASCGGSPFDINMIQAHKTLDAAARTCLDGGTILLLAACGEGLGHPDFRSWFAPATSRGMADELCERYHVNRQTAWSVMEKTERFNVQIVTSLDAATIDRMRMQKIDPSEIARVINKNGRRGYILPTAAKNLFTLEATP